MSPECAIAPMNDIRSQAMIKSRIREIRREKGLTLQQVASKAGTTAQTIGRLETGMRTLSINWVKRIAEALEADPSELLSLPGGGDISVSGEINRAGKITRREVGTIALRLAATNPVALRIKENMGQYRVGDTIVFDRKEDSDPSVFAGRECLVTLGDGREVFCRYIFSADNQLATIIPLSDRSDIEEEARIEQAAPAVALFRRLG